MEQKVKETQVSIAYSTGEIDTGSKWINGKTIYRKVIDLGAGPASGNKDVPHNITGLEMLVSLNAIGWDGSQSYIEANTPASSGGYDRLIVLSGNLRLTSSNNRSSFTFHAIMEYTKS